MGGNLFRICKSEYKIERPYYTKTNFTKVQINDEGNDFFGLPSFGLRMWRQE